MRDEISSNFVASRFRGRAYRKTRSTKTRNHTQNPNELVWRKTGSRSIIWCAFTYFVIRSCKNVFVCRRQIINFLSSLPVKFRKFVDKLKVKVGFDIIARKYFILPNDGNSRNLPITYSLYTCAFDHLSIWKWKFSIFQDNYQGRFKSKITLLRYRKIWVH